MHSFTVNCDTFSNEEKVAAVVPVTRIGHILQIFYNFSSPTLDLFILSN